MAKIHNRWKVALGVLLSLLGALGMLLYLAVTGVVQFEKPGNQWKSAPLPEGVTFRDVCAKEWSLRQCWMEVANQPGCYVWTEVDRSSQAVRWNGECSEGFGEGTGTWVNEWRFDLYFFSWSIFGSTDEGMMVQGRRQGPWIGRHPDGSVEEKSFLEGFRHGIQTTRHTDGSTIEVRFLLGSQDGFPIERGPDGEEIPNYYTEFEANQESRFRARYQNGKREIEDADGVKKEAFYVEDERLEAWGLKDSGKELKETPVPDSGTNGVYVLRLADRTEAEGTFVDGKMQGEWTFYEPNSTTLNGRYDDNYRTGDWTITLSNGTVHKGPLRGPNRNGKWINKYSDGSIAEGTYKNGIQRGEWMHSNANGDVWRGHYLGGKHAQWTRKSPDGTLLKGLYLRGTEYGLWTETSPDGRIGRGPLLNEKKSGPWLETHPDGTTAEGSYAADKRYGHWIHRYANGEVHEGPYVRGNRDGNWLRHKADGTTINETWEDGTLITSTPQ